MSNSLIYLYGIVPGDAPDPPPDLRGLEGEEVRLLRVGRLAGITSLVPREEYSDASLDQRMQDLSWVGDRGMAHERVVDWFAERGPIIPLSLLSLHTTEEKAARRIESGEDEYARILERLRGVTEWGIKLWRNESAVREGIDRLSPALQQLASELEAAPPGKRFLLERKRETLRTEEIRSLSKRLAHDAYTSLAGAAEEGRLLQLPSVAGGERTLLLHSAYLVRNDGFETFQQRVTRLAAALKEAGFEMEFTGPWPPYHFTTPGDD